MSPLTSSAKEQNARTNQDAITAYPGLIHMIAKIPGRRAVNMPPSLHADILEDADVPTKPINEDNTYNIDTERER